MPKATCDCFRDKLFYKPTYSSPQTFSLNSGKSQWIITKLPISNFQCDIRITLFLLMDPIPFWCNVCHDCKFAAFVFKSRSPLGIHSKGGCSQSLFSLSAPLTALASSTWGYLGALTVRIRRTSELNQIKYCNNVIDFYHIRILFQVNQGSILDCHLCLFCRFARCSVK